MNQTKGENMHKPKFNNNTRYFLNQLPFLILMLALTLQVFLTGCASINRKEESVQTILQKENLLIEKLKIERGQPEIVQAVSTNEALKKAEAHLILGFDEMLKANEVIKTKILKQQPKEVENGESERTHDGSRRRSCEGCRGT
ncbi:MAG: hypothetical protein AB7J46_07940 [Candidatus Altimarinota bacterium]